jgi:S1-C subfamily serine protease
MLEIVEWKCPRCNQTHDGSVYECSCGYIFGKEPNITQERGTDSIFKNREEYEAWKARKIKENEEKFDITNRPEVIWNKAYNLHYEGGDKVKAYELYTLLINRFPESPEAGYAKQQKKYLEEDEKFEQIKRKIEEKCSSLEKHKEQQRLILEKIKDKKQNSNNFIIEYTTYSQAKHVRKEEAEKEITQEHINNKALSSVYVNQIYDKTNPRHKIFIITASVFSLLIILISSYFIFKNDSPQKIYEKNVKAAVLIETYDLLGKPIGQGSGFILAEDGLVATNYHVIKDAASMEVETHDEAILKPEGVLYIDQDNDMALVKLKTKEEAKLYKAKIGDPSKLEVGEKIYTIGSPEGFKDSFSEGIVSQIREINGNKLIQITAPISHGSSGGAVLNKKGQVIGISSLIHREGQNLNFAYPIDLIRDAVKSRDIIYTFPNINASWQFVGRIQRHDSGVLLSNINTDIDVYYDPNSIITISGDRKGFWNKMTYNSTANILFYGFERQLNMSSSSFSFGEIDCNSSKIRAKAIFFIDDENKVRLLFSDFSKDQNWREYRYRSPLWKMADNICSSQ